jgi:hypothetical protein
MKEVLEKNKSLMRVKLKNTMRPFLQNCFANTVSLCRGIFNVHLNFFFPCVTNMSLYFHDDFHMNFIHRKLDSCNWYPASTDSRQTALNYASVSPYHRQLQWPHEILFVVAKHIRTTRHCQLNSYTSYPDSIIAVQYSLYYAGDATRYKCVSKSQTSAIRT